MVCLCLVLMLCLTAYSPTLAKSARLPARGGRLVNGTVIPHSKFPYMVEVIATLDVTGSDGKIEQEKINCSGIILTPKLILTAAHCFYGALYTHNPEKLAGVEVIAGTKSYKSGALAAQRRGARKIVLSPEFNPDIDPAKTTDDVALVILGASLDYNDEVKQIALYSAAGPYPSETDDFGWVPGTTSRDVPPVISAMWVDAETQIECLALGYGESGSTGGYKAGIQQDGPGLRFVKTHLRQDEMCREWNCNRTSNDREIGCTKQYWKDGEVCTFDDHTSACDDGDGGGPLVCSGMVYGVFAYSTFTFDSIGQCAAGSLNVYANIRQIHKIQTILYDKAELRELIRFPKYKKTPSPRERLHPFVVEVRVYTGDNQEWGVFTGTIISTNLILTACHCVMDDGDIVEASEVEVLAGQEPHIQKSRAKHIITHPTCTRKLRTIDNKRSYVFENNVAFLVLESSLTFEEFVQSIELGALGLMKDMVKNNTECQVYGYGLRNPSSADERAASSVSVGTVWLTGEKKCRQRLCNVTQNKDDDMCTLTNYYHSGLMCGFRDDTDTCFGNTGGPVVCHGKVYGIDSYWQPCKLRPCQAIEDCYDWPALFMNSVPIAQLYGIVKNNGTIE